MLLASFGVYSQEVKPYDGKFESIDRLLSPPSPYRTASGAPGKEYWQQRADYKIKASISEDSNLLEGEETITYYNNSPDDLKYLWLNLEQNVNRKGNEEYTYLFNVKDSISSAEMQYMFRVDDYPAGTEILSVKDQNKQDLNFVVNNTMMKLLLPEALRSGEHITFTIQWKNFITDRSKFSQHAREGYEYFPKDDNKVFLLGHWFPRMAVYNDTEGWQNKQFRRLGEFALEFGDYQVEITVPADHVVAGTGELVNEAEVLSKTQIDRLSKARSSFDEVVMIITPEEARDNESKKASGTKTWKFEAKNVRDVAYASSRKFIWDAQAVKLPTNTVMAMSFYPNEGLPVWSEESTHAVKQALEVYSEATFDYPYPVAISVNASNIGMEFPMISFNGGRPIKGKMSEAAKHMMVRVIVHEVGHNWFPMIVSSDERKWGWMDEGLNTFLDQRTMAQRYPQWKSITPKDIVPFMMGDPSILRPIMTNSDNDLLSQFYYNFYEKPTIGFQMLRETIVGQELFDAALKEYANRWKYKHPNPADLFRTLEDGIGMDLDWFFKGWFFTTDVVDLELSDVKWFQLKEEKATVERTELKGKIMETGSDHTSAGFAVGPQEITMLKTPDAAYGNFLSRLDENQVRAKLSGKHLYQLTFKNKGGLVMPIIIEWTYADGSVEREQLEAVIWRHNESEVTKAFMKDKEVIKVVVDPDQDLADTNMDNNAFPPVKTKTRFEEFKENNE